MLHWGGYLSDFSLHFALGNIVHLAFLWNNGNKKLVVVIIIMISLQGI